MILNNVDGRLRSLWGIKAGPSTAVNVTYGKRLAQCSSLDPVSEFGWDLASLIISCSRYSEASTRVSAQSNAVVDSIQPDIKKRGVAPGGHCGRRLRSKRAISRFVRRIKPTHRQRQPKVSTGKPRRHS